MQEYISLSNLHQSTSPLPSAHTHTHLHTKKQRVYSLDRSTWICECVSSTTPLLLLRQLFFFSYFQFGVSAIGYLVRPPTELHRKYSYEADLLAQV